jgi:PAS domain S-box-containing protein
MVQWLQQLLGAEGFVPRWVCGPIWRQQPFWGWLHIVSDVATWGAYVAIPLVIWGFVRHRRDVPFSRLFWLFGAFIFACGTVHLLEALLFWWPAYRLSGLVKFATAVVSWTAVVALVRVVPVALTLRYPRELEAEIQERTQQFQDMADRLQREVVERGRVAASLRANEEQLQLVLQAGRMGTWDWDLTTGLAKFNAGQMALTGLGGADGVVDGDDFFDLIHPEDRRGVTKAIEAAVRRLQPYDHEFRITTPEGTLRWLAARGEVMFNEADQPVRMVGVNFDITRRKLDEEDLRLRRRAMEFATNGILIADARLPDRPVISVNPAFTTLTGYSAEETLGRNCRFLQGPQTDRATIDVMRQAVESRAECAVTVLNYRKDGTTFWNDLQISPITDEQGQVTHFVGIMNDVTERVNAEWELWEAREAAEAANRAKSRFLASMSHEIRTPLTAVLGCADLLYRQVDGDESRELAKAICDQGQLLLRLLNDVLDLSKIEAGKLELHVEPCAIQPLVDDVKSLMQPLAAEKGLELRAEVDPSVPEKVRLYPLRLRQILLNLTTNAIKFTDSGFVAWRFRCDSTTAEPALIIEVRDTGVGISPARLRKIFSAFYQIEHDNPNRGPGTGLGLAIVRKLVELHRGSISVDSHEGQGSTFTIRLPLETLQPETEPGPNDSSEPVAGRPEMGATKARLPCRMLVAEDTRGLQFMLKRMLADLVADVVVVGNGEEAVQAVRDAAAAGAPFDLVLMDMQMPVRNGFDATGLLRTLGYNLPIIALTAGAMTGEREKCLAAGCSDFLSKPIDRDQLVRTLRRHYAASQIVRVRESATQPTGA